MQTTITEEAALAFVEGKIFRPYCGDERIMLSRKFSRLTPIRCLGVDIANKRHYWMCVCDCGNYKVTSGHSLTNRHTKSCGCAPNGRAHKTIVARPQVNTPTIREKTAMAPAGRMGMDEIIAHFGITKEEVLHWLAALSLSNSPTVTNKTEKTVVTPRLYTADELYSLIPDKTGLPDAETMLALIGQKVNKIRPLDRTPPSTKRIYGKAYKVLTMVQPIAMIGRYEPKPFWAVLWVAKCLCGKHKLITHGNAKIQRKCSCSPRTGAKVASLKRGKSRQKTNVISPVGGPRHSLVIENDGWAMKVVKHKGLAERLPRSKQLKSASQRAATN